MFLAYRERELLVQQLLLEKLCIYLFIKIVKTLPVSRRLYQLVTHGGYLSTSLKFQRTWLWKQHPVTTFGRSSRSSLQTS